MKKVKKQTQAIARAYAFLDSANLSTLDGHNKIAVIRNLRILDPIGSAYLKHEDKAIKEFAPNNFEEIAYKFHHAMHELPPEEQEAVIKTMRELDIAVSECVRDAAEKQVEIELHSFNNVGLEQLAEGNPSMPKGALNLIMDLMDE